MTDHSEFLDELAKALSAAQGEMPRINLDASAQVAQRTFKYATLSSVVNKVRPVLAKHGLSVVQTSKPDPEGCVLTTTLLHSSGQFVSGTMFLPLVTQTPQSYGSAMTYGRRYSLAGMLGIAADDDLDGHQEEAQGPRPIAQVRAGAQSARATQQRVAGDLSHEVVVATPADWSLFWVRARDLGYDSQALHLALGVKSIKEDMADQPLSKILDWVERQGPIAR